MTCESKNADREKCQNSLYTRYKFRSTMRVVFYTYGEVCIIGYQVFNTPPEKSLNVPLLVKFSTVHVFKST